LVVRDRVERGLHDREDAPVREDLRVDVVVRDAWAGDDLERVFPVVVGSTDYVTSAVDNIVPLVAPEQDDLLARDHHADLIRGGIRPGCVRTEWRGPGVGVTER